VPRNIWSQSLIYFVAHVMREMLFFVPIFSGASRVKRRNVVGSIQRSLRTSRSVHFAARAPNNITSSPV
jgi:hypothetical protein